MRNKRLDVSHIPALGPRPPPHPPPDLWGCSEAGSASGPPAIKRVPRAHLGESQLGAAAARPPAMACTASAPAAPAHSHFWEMLSLLAREPGMEWLELSLAGQAVTSPPRSREAPRSGREMTYHQQHSLGPWPLKTLSLLERSGDSRLWQAYLEGLRKFLVFREIMGMPAAWPIPVEQIRGFLAVESNFSASKTLIYMAALSYLSKLTCSSDPLQDPITCCMVTGLKRRVGIPRDIYLPVTIEILRSLLGALESVCITHYECLLFRALFTVAFFGALRIGEMVAKHRNVLQPELLYLSDIQLMARKVLLFLPYSPVDQERHVISLALSGEPWVCPVLALRSYLTARSQQEGPLFVHSDLRSVTKREFLAVLRCALSLLGLCPEQFGVHSFWMGTAVTAARCGYPGEDVTRLARWPCMIPGRF
ncbi:uncharacterized protein LOC107202702 [Parus major]|uniref:uncharacterized protein LOC107202702 n=1 Tax=Parus major TaxID=9157 RepID=UPI00144409DF|nr:uncharacterized protein LOC107202702 [Parus major]